MTWGSRLQRLLPFLGVHHILMLWQTAVIILASITLAGCSSYSTMTNIYILRLSYTGTTQQDFGAPKKNLFDVLHNLTGSAELEVRAGYFGMCVRQRGLLWLCTSDANALLQQIGPENDPLDLIGMAASFKDDVLFSGLMLMAIVLAFISTLLLATFPGWHEERDTHTGSDVDVKPFPSRPVAQLALSASLVAAILLLIAGLWQHVGAVGAAAMAQTANVGNVGTTIGTNAMVMTWISVVVEFLVAVTLLIVILSIIVLDRLTDDD